VTPEALQVVVRARFFLEDVDDEVAEVHQHPFATIVALNADSQVAGVFELKVDFVTDGLVLFGTRSGTDDEVIAEAGYFAKVQHLDVSCFLGFCCPDCGKPTW